MEKKLLLLFTLITTLAFGQWNTNSMQTNSICVATKSQDNIKITTDALGGAIMVWEDNRNSSTNSTDVFAQRINKSGVLIWQANGIAICNNAFNQKSPSITSLGNGQSIIVWEDSRNNNYDIYAQKIDTLGSILWALNGVQLCSKTTNQKNPKIISDNNGGAFVVFEDSINNFWDITAQKIDANGNIQWTSNGKSICNSTNAQINPKIEPDGAGGLIIVWQDKRNNVDYDIYAQRLDASGAEQWTANGVAVCNAVNTQSNPQLEFDGNNAIVAWTDKRNAVDLNIYTQKINLSGITQWAVNGELVCNAAGNQSALEMKNLTTNATILVWKDSRSANTNIYTQIINSSGVGQLATNGVAISFATKTANPYILKTENNDAVITWQDSSVLGWDIIAQKLSATGNVVWSNGAVIVSNAAEYQINQAQVSDGNNGLIAVWEDYRNNTDNNIYATHLFSNGGFFAGLKTEISNRMSVFPIPTGSELNFEFMNGDHYSGSIEIKDINSKIIEKVNFKNKTKIELNTENYVNGMYFYEIYFFDGEIIIGKFVK